MLLILLTSSIYTTNSLIQQQATLNAQKTSENGATIHYNSRTVTPLGTNFEINVKSDPYDPYDLKLSLNKSWSFQPSITSTITLTLNGYTYSPNTDTDIIMLFSVGNKQYFSFFFHLDDNSNHVSIYPSLYNTQNVSKFISDTKKYELRYHRICNAYCDQWINLNWNQQSLWPLKFTITNHPNQQEQYSTFKFYHDLSSQLITSYTFNTSFIPNQPIDIYIMGEWKNERFAVSTFNLFTKYNPTINPTIIPTINPTVLPSKNPTITPTKIPTIIPTITPTILPTIIPTITPSTNPTNTPSIIPSIDPTMIPTQTNITIGNIQTISDTNINVTPLGVDVDVQNVYTTLTVDSTYYIEETTLEMINDDDNYFTYMFIFYTVAFVALIAIIMRLYFWYKNKHKQKQKQFQHSLHVFEQVNTSNSRTCSDIEITQIGKRASRESSDRIIKYDKSRNSILHPILEINDSNYSFTSTRSTKEIQEALHKIQEEINAELKHVQHRIILLPEQIINTSSDEMESNDVSKSKTKSKSKSKTNSINNAFYTELSMLYHPALPMINIYGNDIYESEEDDLTTIRKHTLSVLDPIVPIQMKTRKYSQSHSLLPINSVFKLRIQENVSLQNEFDLFRLLIDDMEPLIKSLNTFNIDTLCDFLPLILFKASKCEKQILNSKINYVLILISELSKIGRLLENDDITQKLHFMSNCFNIVNKGEHNYEKIKGLLDNAYKIWLQNSTKYNSTKCFNNAKDLTRFWETVLNLNEDDTKIIKYNQKCSFYIRDPVQPNQAPLREIKVCKQFESATKPILCELWTGHSSQNYGYEWNLSSHIILKKGDDLRKDYAITCMFKYMNYIWKMERDNIESEFNNLSYESSIVKILTFDVVPMSGDFGAIQLISNCVPLRHVEHLKDDLEKEHIYQLITSAAASYIGSYVCGIRDRHFENILIRVADATLFHIDFGYCVGETIKFALDASPFGITNTLKDLMNYGQINNDLYIEKFVPICVDAYMSLRKHYKSLVKFAQLAFSYIKKENDIENFVKNRLKIFDNKRHKKWNNKQYVEEWLKKELITAPKDMKTIRKNKLRKFLSPSSTVKTSANNTLIDGIDI